MPPPAQIDMPRHLLDQQNPGSGVVRLDGRCRAAEAEAHDDDIVLLHEIALVNHALLRALIDCPARLSPRPSTEAISEGMALSSLMKAANRFGMSAVSSTVSSVMDVPLLTLSDIGISKRPFLRSESIAQATGDRASGVRPHEFLWRHHDAGVPSR